jgi:hypothetical protein
MVSNQSVRRFPGKIAGVAALSALALAGCQYLPHKGPAPAPAPEAAPAPAVQPAPRAAAAPAPTAVEAAIARAALEPRVTVAPEPAPAPAVAIKSTAPLSYTVKSGDTLWDISSMYLKDPWLWPEIWHVNPAVENPHLIYPGDVLTLATGANGQPEVTVTRVATGPVIRVQPLLRKTPIEGPIATIPYDAIKAFLGRPSFVSKDDLKSAPRIAGLRDHHIVAGAGQDIYIKGMQNQEPGRFAVVRVGDELKDPDTGKVLGYMGIHAGTARVDRITDVTKAQLVDSARESVAGDLLFAEEAQSVSRDLLPRSPPAGVDGQIIGVVDGVAVIGTYQVVAINRGTSNGIQAGHVLAIDSVGEVVPDGSCKQERWSFCGNKTITLPSERAGTLLVFKTYDKLSYGLIVDASVPIRVTDRVRTP